MAALVPVSKRPPQRYLSGADFALWLQRFELYITEADIAAEKKANELVSLLDDEPFRIANQLGLIGERDFDKVKDALLKQFAPEGNVLEWQMLLNQRLQKPGEKLADFAGDLCRMSDKAYPKWDPKIRLELARPSLLLHNSSQLKQPRRPFIRILLPTLWL